SRKEIFFLSKTRPIEFIPPLFDIRAKYEEILGNPERNQERPQKHRIRHLFQPCPISTSLVPMHIRLDTTTLKKWAGERDIVVVVFVFCHLHGSAAILFSFQFFVHRVTIWKRRPSRRCWRISKFFQSYFKISKSHIDSRRPRTVMRGNMGFTY